MNIRNFLTGAAVGVTAVAFFLIGRSCAPGHREVVVRRDTVIVKEIFRDTVTTIIKRELQPIYIIQSPETVVVETVWNVADAETPFLLYYGKKKGNSLVLRGAKFYYDTSDSSMKMVPRELSYRVPWGSSWWFVSTENGLSLHYERRLIWEPYLGVEAVLGRGGYSYYPLAGISASFWALEGLVEASTRGLGFRIYLKPTRR